MRKPAVLAAAIAVVLASWGHSASAQATASPTAPTAVIGAIRTYVAAEDNNFADLQGDPTGNADPTFTYYQTSLQIPGASACVVYIVKQNLDHFATCDFDAATEKDARELFNAWVDRITASEPSWKMLHVKNGNHLLQLIAEDPQGVHGIYLYTSKSDDGKSYRVTTTFATVAAIQR